MWIWWSAWGVVVCCQSVNAVVWMPTLLYLQVKEWVAAIGSMLVKDARDVSEVCPELCRSQPC